MNQNMIAKVTITVAATFFVVVATAFGTIKVMDHREQVLLDNAVIEKIGLESFGELDRIETKTVTYTTYYNKDGSIIQESKESSDKTENYNNQ